MKAYLVQLRERFTALTPREQKIVGGGSVIAALMLLYFGMWEPLVKAHHNRERSLVESRGLAQRLEAIAVDAQRARTSGAVNRGGSLVSVVDQASRSPTLGKQPRLQPEGDSEVRLWVDAVSFDALVRWLADLQTRYGVQVSSAEIEKQSQPGTVNARLTLTRP